MPRTKKISVSFSKRSAKHATSAKAVAPVDKRQDKELSKLRSITLPNVRRYHDIFANSENVQVVSSGTLVPRKMLQDGDIDTGNVLYDKRAGNTIRLTYLKLNTKVQLIDNTVTEPPLVRMIVLWGQTQATDSDLNELFGTRSGTPSTVMTIYSKKQPQTSKFQVLYDKTFMLGLRELNTTAALSNQNGHWSKYMEVGLKLNNLKVLFNSDGATDAIDKGQLQYLICTDAATGDVKETTYFRVSYNA